MAQTQERTDVASRCLSNDERIALGGYAARASWPAGFQIYEHGTAADGVFVVLSGRVVLRSRVRAGRGFVPWVATPGETFGAEGLSANALYATGARADAESETLFLSASKLRAFVREQPSHAIALIGQLMAERTALLDKLREISSSSVEQRLVAALQRMALHEGFLDRNGRIELCTPRYRLLCELVGATRESVALAKRVCRKLVLYDTDGIRKLLRESDDRDEHRRSVRGQRRAPRGQQAAVRRG